jgi:alkylation response protein AidB-like acyl-CoA dehydrogenase
MNLELSDEQAFLRDAARQALVRTNTVEAAREQLDGGERPDLWPVAVEAGWPGLLVGEAGGGAGLGAFDALLVLQEAGRRLAGAGLLGHLPATELLDAGGFERLEAVAAGELRACFVPAEPPGDLDEGWTVDSAASMAREPAPTVGEDGTVSGRVPWVPDAPGADLYVVVATRGGAPVAVAVEAGAGVQVEEVVRYDATRALGHVTLDGARGTVLEVPAGAVERAWHLVQALVAAEAVGAVETCLEMATQYAKERYTFGRPIGSYQAVKHSLVEIMRRLENARSLLYYVGWAHENGSDELAIATAAARSSAGEALEYAARANIAVHGGIGATWEHDAPLFFRRAQLTRRLLGGTSGATDRVAGELLRTAAGAGDDDAQPATAAAATSVDAG